MWIKFDDASVRLAGRWAVWGETAAATAPGAYLEAAFQGEMAVLHFDTAYSTEPYPHVWIGVDGGALVEASQDRWWHPLVGKIAFLGLEADAPDALEPDGRRTIEFVGDSITEGVLIDESCRTHANDQFDRPCQDDVTAGYAWLTAQALDLRPVMRATERWGPPTPAAAGYPRRRRPTPTALRGPPSPIRRISSW